MRLSVRPVRVVVLALVALLSSSAAVSAGAREDGYLSGYAAAVLEREFRLPAPSLRVHEGVITLDAADLAGADRAAVVTALTQIRGTVRVAVVDRPAPPAPAGVATAAPSTVTSTTSPGDRDHQIGLFPGGQLFEPLIADPRWPHFGASYQRYINDPQLKDVASVSFGETFTVYRDSLGKGWWELGLQAGVFSLFDLNAESKDLVNADYFVAGTATYRLGAFSALGRLFHQSSHLGDEFLLRNRIQRVNLSYEGVDLKLSYELFGDVLRVYGGGGYLLNHDPSSLKPGSVQSGLEFRSPWPGSDYPFRPIAAIDIQNRETNDWHTDVSLRAGLELKGVLMTRNVQFLLEYFSGHSPNGQFYRQKIDYIGLGAHLHF